MLPYPLDGFAPWSWSWGHGKSTSQGHCSERGKVFTRHSAAVMFITSPCEAAQGRNSRNPVQIKAAEADGPSVQQQLHHEPTAPSPKHGNEERLICASRGEACSKVVSLSRQINNGCTAMAQDGFPPPHMTKSTVH